MSSRREPAEWTQHFSLSLGTGWATDVDGFIHNRRVGAGRANLFEFKPSDWKPSRERAQLEAQQHICHDYRTNGWYLLADWPEGIYTPEEADAVPPPQVVVVKNIWDVAGKGERMDWDKYLAWRLSTNGGAF